MCAIKLIFSVSFCVSNVGGELGNEMEGAKGGRVPLELSLPFILAFSLEGDESTGPKDVRDELFSAGCDFSFGALPSNILFNLPASSSKSTKTLGASTCSAVMPETTLDLGVTNGGGDSDDGEPDCGKARVRSKGLGARRDRWRLVEGRGGTSLVNQK